VLYEHRLRIRYAECDMQQVVFNAHYLAFVDDAVDCWMRSTLGGTLHESGFDCMVKKAEITWFKGATFGDDIVIRLGVTKFGVTSFEVLAEGFIAQGLNGEVVKSFEANLLYVSTVPGQAKAQPVPSHVREKFAVYSR
jgi:acyl-CoA thioester hydrolase